MVEDPESQRLRVLVYQELASLEALNLALGALPSAAAGEGLPLPDPSSAFLSGALTEPEPAWSPVSDLRASALPWRVPGSPPGSECPDLSSDFIVVPGFELVRPRTMLALSDTELLIAGHWTEPTGRDKRESMLVLVSGLDAEPRFESIGAPLEGDAYRGLVRLAPREFLAASERGWLTRFHLDTRESRSEPALPASNSWRLSVGEDGAVVAFQPVENFGRSAQWAYDVDADALTATQLESPERLLQVSLVRRDHFFVAGEHTFYRYEAGSWSTEHQSSGLVTELAHRGERAVGIVDLAVVLERVGAGSWIERPQPFSMLELSVAGYLSDGRLVVGGGGGHLLQYREGEWCEIPRFVPREVMALAAAPSGTTGFAVTYSEQAGIAAGITRFSIRR